MHWSAILQLIEHIYD